MYYTYTPYIRRILLVYIYASALSNSDKQGASRFLKMINVLKLFGQINLSQETYINEN